jgi:hypothetical protein
MNQMGFFVRLIVIVIAFLPVEAICQHKQSIHRNPERWEIPVSEAGIFDIPGATYLLVNDISSPVSTVFLGKDVTLDLNGYTLTYADGSYGHVENYGFENGLEGWDVSKAPGAKIVKTEEVRPFIGDKMLSLKAGDEITSSYVYLPLANRSYFAMCGITGTLTTEMRGDFSKNMFVSIYVEDEHGNDVRVVTTYGDSARVSCPVIKRSARLGGGFITAHLNNLPAGKYRVRVKAETDCMVDEIDIRPAMDVGIGIVEKTHPMGHNDHLYAIAHAAFFDYTADVKTGKPIDDIPVVKGRGYVTIKNGNIKNGTVGILSWGIQSTARDVKIIIDNVKFYSSGINTTAVDVPQATITNCIFEIDNPFIINRHGAEFYAVDLRGPLPSEVSFCSFYGGQGNLVIKGKNSSVHNNFFVNRQTVTNHYSIMAMGDGSRIFENVFKPEIGSALEIFRHKNIDIFNNEFHIHANPPSCEYPTGNSANAIRIADYGAAPGSPEGASGNRIFNNKFYITGRKFRQYPHQRPTANAFFYSASAGDNEIFGNYIVVNNEDPETNAEAYAFYIGNARGGKIYNNHIVSNVTPIWVGTSYHHAEEIELTGNIIEKAPDAHVDFVPVRMGSGSNYLATDIQFRSNEFIGTEFQTKTTDQENTYSVFWTLDLVLHNKAGQPLGDTDIAVFDRLGQQVAQMKTGKDGSAGFELLEYKWNGKSKAYLSPYTITYGKNKREVELNKNTSIQLMWKK